MAYIEDGTGKGNLLKVGSDNRAQVRAVIESEVIHNGESGLAYNVNTGLINVSGDATLFYVKNTSDRQLIVSGIAIGVGKGMTHSDVPYLKVHRNPTGGDLISDEAPVEINGNRNFASALDIEATIYKGKSGGTVTGGSVLGLLQTNSDGRSFYQLDLILPKGNSMAVTMTPNLSAGSANVYLALICYYKDDQDIG